MNFRLIFIDLKSALIFLKPFTFHQKSENLCTHLLMKWVGRVVHKKMKLFPHKRIPGSVIKFAQRVHFSSFSLLKSYTRRFRLTVAHHIGGTSCMQLHAVCIKMGRSFADIFFQVFFFVLNYLCNRSRVDKKSNIKLFWSTNFETLVKHLLWTFE